MNYVTTNIRLPEEDYLRLKEEAAKKRKSLAAVIRDKVGVKKLSRKEWLNAIQTMDTSWFTEEDYKNYKKARKEWDERLKKLNW